MTDVLTAFGLSASDSDHFADILAAASSNANTNVSMMGETFKYCAPIAGALGFSAEDTAEAIGLMANAGIKGSQAGTALRTIMNNLTGEVILSGKAFGEVTIATTNTDGQTYFDKYAGTAAATPAEEEKPHEQIDTATASGEMLLTILSAFAQEESRNISENLKWGIRKRYEMGQSRGSALYGYRLNEQGETVIEPNEGEIVRSIFNLYREGTSLPAIVVKLNALDIPSPRNQNH